MFILYSLFIGWILGIFFYLFVKYRRFKQLNNSNLVGSKKIAERAHYKKKVRSALIMLLAVIRGYIFFEVNNQLGTIGNRVIAIFILFLFIPIIYYGVQALLGDIYTTTDVVNKIHNFSLYLRPFDTESHPKSKFLERRFSYFLKGFCKLYAIGNPNSIQPAIGSELIYATNDEWKASVSQLMNDATIIILRLGNSNGCYWEIKNCFLHKLQHKTIFIANDIFEYQILKDHLCGDETIPNIELTQDCPVAIYYHAFQQKWVYTHIYNRRTIRRLCIQFIQANKPSQELYQTYLDQRSNILHVFNKQTLFKQIQLRNICLGFILNPVLYIAANRWSWKIWGIPCLIVFALPITFFTSKTIFWTCVSLLIGLWLLLSLFARRISFLSRIWPNEEALHNEEDIISDMMFDYIKAYILYVVSMYILILCLM